LHLNKQDHGPTQLPVSNNQDPTRNTEALDLSKDHLQLREMRRNKPGQLIQGLKLLLRKHQVKPDLRQLHRELHLHRPGLRLLHRELHLHRPGLRLLHKGLHQLKADHKQHRKGRLHNPSHRLLHQELHREVLHLLLAGLQVGLREVHRQVLEVLLLREGAHPQAVLVVQAAQVAVQEVVAEAVDEDNSQNPFKAPEFHRGFYKTFQAN
jgi:hypothetical protein